MGPFRAYFASPALRPIWLGLAFGIPLVALCYAFIDRPVARWMHEFAGHAGWRWPSLLPEAVAAAAILALVLALAQVAGMVLSRLLLAVFLASVSLVAASTLKDGLKYAFGRTWPETWGHGNPSFIGSGVYGFFPFHGGAGWLAFPSGHAAAVAAVLGTFGLCHRPLAPFAAAAIAAMGAGLVAKNFHFVSDVVAGTMLGLGTAYVVVRLAWPRALVLMRQAQARLGPG